jgi:Asp-tRNA(Asn)/Glu-tRNA(Gln) amidotransferase A subunit family amidase
MYLSDVYTVSANLAGLPGVSLPCGSAGGLPIGLQLLAPPLDEAMLLRVADAYQRRTSHHLAYPPVVASRAQQVSRSEPKASEDQQESEAERRPSG